MEYGETFALTLMPIRASLPRPPQAAAPVRRVRCRPSASEGLKDFVESATRGRTTRQRLNINLSLLVTMVS